MAYLEPYGFLIVLCVAQAVLALSLYLPLLTGQLSLASPGFYALGGYIAAVLSTKVFAQAEDGSFPVVLLLAEMLLAAVACAVLAVIVGIPALRLQGIYLALATIAFVEIFRVLSLNLPIAGGAVGIFGIPQPFDNQLGYLWVGVPLLLLACLFVSRLERSRTGRSFTAIREDDLAAGAMGIDLARAKLLSFVLGAILAGSVGALSAHFLNTWNSRQGTFDASIAFLAFVLIGGSRTWLGPVVGGIALTALPELLRSASEVGALPLWLGQFLKDGRFIFYGLLLAAGCLFFPQGLISPALYARGARLFRRRDAGSGERPPGDSQPPTRFSAGPGKPVPSAGSGR